MINGVVSVPFDGEIKCCCSLFIIRSVGLLFDLYVLYDSVFFLRSRAPLIQLGGLRERCKLPQRGLGQPTNDLVHFCRKI